jgi:sirohydrochlorin cobaltochelatase
VSLLFQNDALLLIGHGSIRYPGAAGAMRRHAKSLREAGRFAQVEIGLLNGSPSVDAALARIKAPIIRVVPFFMEDGYFSRVEVPRALGRRPVLIGSPVGAHDGIAGVIERQALAACADCGFPSHTAAVFIVGHGSTSKPGRALALHRHASRVASTTLFARVEAACLEEEPFVANALRGLRAHPVVVIGFFANQGGHVRDDVPALIAAEQTSRGAAGLVVHFHGSAIDDPAIVPIILDQAMSVPGAD